VNKLPLLLLLALLSLSSVFFFRSVQTIPTISDTIGYVYAGQRLAAGHGLTYEDSHNELAGPYFSLYAFQIRRPDDARMFLGYPPGFPLLLAAGVLLTGWTTAVYYVTPILAVVGLIATFLVGALIGKSQWTGLWAVVILLLAPTFWDYATAPWSEVPSLAFITLGVACYLLSHRYRQIADNQPASSRVKANRAALLFSLAAGGLIAYSFFIRYSNLVVVAPLGLYELVTSRQHILRDWRRWPVFIILAGGVLAIPLFNHFYYGGVTLTSYSPAHGWYPWPAFAWEYAMEAPRHGLRRTGETLWANFPGFLLAVPLGWFLLRGRAAILVAGLALVTILLYVSYAFPPTGVNSRFLLPAFPFLAVAAAQVITIAGRHFPSEKLRWVAGGLLLLFLLLVMGVRADQLQARQRGDGGYRAHVEQMVAGLPDGAVLLSYRYNDEIRFYTGRSVLNYRRIPPADAEAGRYRHELLEPCLVQTIDRLLALNTPVYYVEDVSPPFWDSLALLQHNYALTLLNPHFKLYQVSWPSSQSPRNEVAPCNP
jgi:hypothetical protein